MSDGTQPLVRVAAAVAVTLVSATAIAGAAVLTAHLLGAASSSHAGLIGAPRHAALTAQTSVTAGFVKVGELSTPSSQASTLVMVTTKR